MSAIQALQAAAEVGIAIEVHNGDLLLAASAEPPAEVLDEISRHKLEIVETLTLEGSGLSADDWLAMFDERAAIIEFDGGLPRELAELQAIGSCVLDERMRRTDLKELQRFVRLLPAHIRRPLSALVEDRKSSVDLGEQDFPEATP